MTTLELTKEYLDHLRLSKGRAPRTVLAYGRYLIAFARFINDKDISDVSLSDIDSYRAYMVKNGLSAATQGYNIIALRGLLKYARRIGIDAVDWNMLDVPESTRQPMAVLNNDEVMRLFNSVDCDNLIGLRDLAILETLFSTGLRVSELISLNRDTIDPYSKSFTIRGKGNKDRLVFISERALEAITHYLDARNDTSPELFTAHSSGANTRINVRTVQRIIKEYAKKAKINKHVTPHVMRHSYATNLLDNGCDLRAVQELLGHASIATTQIYTHITDNKLREAHAKYSVLKG